MEKQQAFSVHIWHYLEFQIHSTLKEVNEWGQFEINIILINSDAL